MDAVRKYNRIEGNRSVFHFYPLSGAVGSRSGCALVIKLVPGYEPLHLALTRVYTTDGRYVPKYSRLA